MTDCEAPKGGDGGRKQSSLAQKGETQHTQCLVPALSGGIEELNILFILFTISTCLILIVYLTFFKHSLSCLLEKKRGGGKIWGPLYSI